MNDKEAMRRRISRLEAQVRLLRRALQDVMNIAVFPPLRPQVKEVLQCVESLLRLNPKD